MENNARNRRPFFFFLLLEKEKRNDKFYSTNMIGGARNFWRQIRILGCKAMPIRTWKKFLLPFFPQKNLFESSRAREMARKIRFTLETLRSIFLPRNGINILGNEAWRGVYRREITNYNYLWKSVRWWIIQAKDGVATRKHEENRPFTINNETRGGNKRRSVK